MRLILVLLFSISVNFPVWAAQPDMAMGKEALSKLVSRLKKIDSITGQFVQYSVDQKGVRLQESKGEFKAQRPGKFYWHTRDPLEQQIYSDGKFVTIYDPDLEQATVQPVSDQIQATPAVLFSGNVDKIGERFRVEMRQWDEVSTQFLLFPKTSDSLFERMLLRFDGAQLAEMRLSDSLGQDNTVSFIQTQVNVAFSPTEFAPELPAGTDVIRDIPSLPSQ